MVRVYLSLCDAVLHVRAGLMSKGVAMYAALTLSNQHWKQTGQNVQTTLADDVLQCWSSMDMNTLDAIFDNKLKPDTENYI